jgi:SAM-dependent methyltransferase
MNAAAGDYAPNLERFTGFAEAYDQHRPPPPAALAGLLTDLAHAPTPDLVVDLGSGTGLSTRYWADRARAVIGVEPTPDMRRQAEARTTAKNISYRSGVSHATGLPDHCAQIVVCCQSLHWMDPPGTFREAARILVPGGVFAACDYDWPPATGVGEADAAFAACVERVRRVERELGAGVHQWDKAGHAARMTASGCFREVREILLPHTEAGDAVRFVGLLLSQGHVMGLLKRGVSETAIGLDVFRAAAVRALGPEPRPWRWNARLRVGLV